MIKVKEAIIVEGNYDKIKLASIVDANIIKTDGFQIFKDKKCVELIKKLAVSDGIIILTDSDAAGFKIRNYIKNVINEGRVLHAFIPETEGKEKRKAKPSKEGTLGVEGIENEILENILKNCGASLGEKKQKLSKITKIDLYKCGYFGKNDSKKKRIGLLCKLNLPSKMSANMMVDVFNTIFDDPLNVLE